MEENFVHERIESMSGKKPLSPAVKIALTKELIEDSKQRDSSHCMIAEAVKAAYPDATYVSVDLQTIRFTDPGKHLRYTYLTPRIAQIALIDFDQGNTPEPFTFTLRRAQVTRSGGTQQRRKLSEAELAQRKEAGMKGVGSRRATLKSQELVGTKSELRDSGSDAGPGGGGSAPPERIGGKTPPTTPFARRREFGIRALVR